MSLYKGFNLVGAWSNPLDIAPNYVGTIMGISGLASYLAGAIVPNTLSLATAFLHTKEAWTFLFFLVAAITIVSNLLFLLLGCAKLQEWNSVGSISREGLNQGEKGLNQGEKGY